MQKISQEDLDRLQNAHQAYSDIRSELADITVLLARIEEKKSMLVATALKHESDLVDVRKDLAQTYNAASINMHTGEYTTNEPTLKS